jgi:iron complex outermembrane receptor protein
MSIKFRRALLGSAALLSLGSLPEVAYSQVELPPVDVTAPSPIQRPPRRPAQPKQAARPAPAAPAPAPVPAPAAELPGPGTLPIVIDQFATVTVVPNEEIRRNGSATLGDLLFTKPGIIGSEFAPGASSRPIIRGLDVNRVGIVENGIGSGGASDLGEDHFVPVDPLTINQVEVIRGPATLRYGSQSIGGVVYSSNNRIPEALPCREGTQRPNPNIVAKAPFAPPSDGCVRAEVRGGADTVNNGINGGFLLDTGKDNFAFHADVFGRRADDYRVPKYPYLVPPDPVDAPRATQPGQFNGRQPNSSLHTNGWSLGGSYLFDGGYAGVAVIQNNALYHIPGIDGENHNTRIDATDLKVLTKGEWRPPSDVIDVIRFWGGATDYKHNEIGFADPLDLSTDGVRQTFTNKEQEGRIEVTLKPFNLRFAELTTAIGVQGGHQELTAPSPDDPGSPLNGLWDPNNNRRIASYIFNEFKFSETTKAQIAGRIERVHLNGMTPTFDSLLFDVNADPASVGPSTAHSLDFTPKSASVGLIQNLPWDLAASITAQHVERAPKAAELFSRGGHDATATFDIGNPNLKTEIADSVEAGLRRAKGPFRFELTGYYTKFTGFIFRSLTGNTCDSSACVDPTDPAGPLELKQAVYSQRDATFRGAEWQSQYDVAPVWMGVWGIENQFDVVRATFSDGTNVPRIPPVRVGGGLFYRDSNWFGRVNLLHAFSQNDIAPIGETPTAGYNDLRAEISYRWKPARLTPDSLSEWVVGIAGTNLLNDDIRNSVSYTKDEVLLPGRGVRFFANAKY